MTFHHLRPASAVDTRRSLLVLLILLAYALPSQAQNVTHLSGDIEVAAFPPSLLAGQFISPTRIRLLHEGPGVVAAGMPGFLYDGAIHDPSRPVAPGDNTFGNAITTPYGGPGLPAVGTQAYSVLLHFDPNLAGLPFSLTTGIARSATITFDQKILGVYVTSGALVATDSIFNPGGVVYSTNPGRDLEFNYDGDVYAISPDRYTLSLTMYGHNGGQFDEARIAAGDGACAGGSRIGWLRLSVLAAALAALGADCRCLRSAATRRELTAGFFQFSAPGVVSKGRGPRFRPLLPRAPHPRPPLRRALLRGRHDDRASTAGRSARRRPRARATCASSPARPPRRRRASGPACAAGPRPPPGRPPGRAARRWCGGRCG